MKIAFFTEGYDPFVNGVVASLKTLRRSLEELGHEVTIFAPGYGGHEDDDPRVTRLPGVCWSRHHYRLLSPLAQNCDVIAGAGFDVIHSHHPFSMSGLAERLAAKHGLPLVYSFHTMLNEYGQYVPLLGPAGNWWLTRRFVRHCNRADHVAVATSVVRDFLRDQEVRTSISVVPEGVPLLQPAPDARQRLRRELGLSRHTSLLLYAGRLAREKRLDFLLRSMSRPDGGRDFHLCLAGGGPLEGNLRDLARELGMAQRVTFLGWVRHEELADYYAAADVFVFPSPADAMGIVLVEAMGLGLPCVAIRKYGPSEVVIHGQTGILTDFDECDFSGAVRRLLDNPSLRCRMGHAARNRARDFDPALAAARLVSVYEDAAAQRSAFRAGGLLATTRGDSHDWHRERSQRV